MTRSTKIVATIGPASANPDVFARMVAAGLDVARLNFSHGKREDHVRNTAMIREVSAAAGREIAIMADLQGPKIRVGRFRGGKVELVSGARFTLDINSEEGSHERVGLDYPDLVDDVVAGNVLLLNDGMIVLDVIAVVGTEIQTRVRIGGDLSNNKGINRQGGGLSAPALTEKDIGDLRTAIEIGADLIAVSFPKSAADMITARALTHDFAGSGAKPKLIAKIERAEAVPALKEIIEASDGIMVARGDLAVEVGNAAVPALQKRMIRMARASNRLVITATQMMESMIQNPVPTRAEVSDVANAVLDGTDAVMLSAESATGRYPVQTVEAMATICAEAERSCDNELDKAFLDRKFHRIDEAIALGALFTAYHLNATAIVALTESGATALWMSRHLSPIPIYAMTARRDSARLMALFRNVVPIVTASWGDRDSAFEQAELTLVKHGFAKSGDVVVLTVGKPMATAGGTNSLKIIKVK
jgi:pyruvate kinase